MKGLKDMKKIDSVCMLIENKIVMLKKYKPYGSDVAIDELQDLLTNVRNLEYVYIDVGTDDVDEE